MLIDLINIGYVKKKGKFYVKIIHMITFFLYKKYKI